MRRIAICGESSVMDRSCLPVCSLFVCVYFSPGVKFVFVFQSLPTIILVISLFWNDSGCWLPAECVISTCLTEAQAVMTKLCFLKLCQMNHTATLQHRAKHFAVERPQLTAADKHEGCRLDSKLMGMAMQDRRRATQQTDGHAYTWTNREETNTQCKQTWYTTD